MSLNIHDNPIAVGKMPVRINSNSLYLPSVPHGKIEDLVIKGDQQMNLLARQGMPYTKENYYQKFGGHVTTVGANNLGFIYDNKCTDIANPGNSYSLNVTNELARLFEIRQDYTINYRIKAISEGFKRRINLYMYDSVAVNATYPIRNAEVGYYCMTFQVKNYLDDNLNSLFAMQYRDGEPFDPNQHEYCEFEILNVVKGKDMFIPYPIGETGGVENIRIYTQEESPILGEYKLGGDIPDILTKIEQGIVNLEDAFKTTWR